MSPLSNNRLFLDYMANPCPTYHARGLNVSLSTDDPLMLHMTKEPLVEEYCIAAQVWKFTATDLCELARNSVLQSDFEERFKRHFLGEAYMRGENDIRLTNVPDLRVRFRNAVLAGEREFLGQAARAHGRKK
jgi:AMP deaminase